MLTEVLLILGNFLEKSYKRMTRILTEDIKADLEIVKDPTLHLPIHHHHHHHHHLVIAPHHQITEVEVIHQTAPDLEGETDQGLEINKQNKSKMSHS